MRSYFAIFDDLNIPLAVDIFNRTSFGFPATSIVFRFSNQERGMTVEVPSRCTAL